MYIYNQKGNALLISIVVVVLLAGIGGYLYSQNDTDSTGDSAMMEDDKMMDGDNMEDDSMMEDEDSMIGDDSSAMMEDDKMMDGDNMEDEKMMVESDVYTDYSQSAYDQAADKKRVLFFHAKWCPTCKAANTAFENNLNKIPADVVLFKTDYDTEQSLKDKYGITYQHTFVQVDANGDAVAKWNGGDIDDLILNIQ